MLKKCVTWWLGVRWGGYQLGPGRFPGWVLRKGIPVCSGPGVGGEFLIVSFGGWDLGRLSVPLSVWRFQTLVVNVDQFQGCV